MLVAIGQMSGKRKTREGGVPGGFWLQPLAGHGLSAHDAEKAVVCWREIMEDGAHEAAKRTYQRAAVELKHAVGTTVKLEDRIRQRLEVAIGVRKVCSGMLWEAMKWGKQCRRCATSLEPDMRCPLAVPKGLQRMCQVLEAHLREEGHGLAAEASKAQRPREVVKQHAVFARRGEHIRVLAHPTWSKAPDRRAARASPRAAQSSSAPAPLQAGKRAAGHGVGIAGHKSRTRPTGSGAWLAKPFKLEDSCGAPARQVGSADRDKVHRFHPNPSDDVLHT
ncbi:hypothetical protein CYMTET_31867 [Cymbomonas tetramitiformis]|uniref:Uncharacterized protein n=1 Tax=Cymbomonas tetramitiformis TaxID=36881 RepID=A0AAE0FGS0_9CHLO|nr:hypothetical protein CYMTET_31867 [Cymbomonas tetramitiformis]